MNIYLVIFSRCLFFAVGVRLQNPLGTENQSQNPTLHSLNVTSDLANTNIINPDI
ncbi:hypothetical protein NIES46_13800 [Arthrospira platensis NIES-46]|uniref:Uncharacterized protein n=1 Tax=Limnospira platensis NIES-46 TaxID=1236695 RepID=A0A5M3T614_LIMPL|nr:hypothetical protein NIES39_J01360 [Arthrospira platensis NIES-39]GCE93330.1 hypothetical protein NIES46_13800 [Arthrospira platensis NIES-46]